MQQKINWLGLFAFVVKINNPYQAVFCTIKPDLV